MRDQHRDRPGRRADRGGVRGVPLVQVVLGLGVQRRRRLVEHHEQRLLAHHRPAQRELLPLPAGQLRAVRVAGAELGVEPVVETRRARPPTVRAVQRPEHGVVRLDPGQVPDADVLAGQQLEPAEVLEAGGGAVAPGHGVEVVQVDAVHGDGAGGGRVEPAQELDQRGLAGTVLADDGDARAGRAGPGRRPRARGRRCPGSVNETPSNRMPSRSVSGAGTPGAGTVCDCTSDRIHARSVMLRAARCSCCRMRHRSRDLLVHLRRERDDEHDVTDGALPGDRVAEHQQGRRHVGDGEHQLTGRPQGVGPDLAGPQDRRRRVPRAARAAPRTSAPSPHVRSSLAAAASSDRTNRCRARRLSVAAAVRASRQHVLRASAQDQRRHRGERQQQQPGVELREQDARDDQRDAEPDRGQQRLHGAPARPVQLGAQDLEPVRVLGSLVVLDARVSRATAR